jgi:hypothetical protein
MHIRRGQAALQELIEKREIEAELEYLRDATRRVTP